MKNHFYIQAKLGSKRLPRKVLKKIQDKTILEIILERLSFIKNKNEIFLLTGRKEGNIELIDESKRLGIEYFTGSENNVLDRFKQASNKFQSETITRITADCPLIDFEIIEKGLKIFNSEKFDILSNNKTKTFPHGLDFEIFKKSALDEAWKNVYNKV
ncbi:MAG: acylneuraminate cytidylyltransferase, partial [Nitrosopumilales archaeon CG11_big_fil_rev_8_21_14_0_20_33_24]